MRGTVMMNSKAEAATTSALDTAKLWFAAIIVAGAMVAFYFFADYPLLYRVVGLLLAVTVAGVIGYQTEPGRQLAGFLKEAQIEVRKVVWPTRDETVKTTMIVVAVVVVVGLFLWMLDAMIGWAVQWLTITRG